MTVAAKRLDAGNCAALVDHFVAVPNEYLRLRFGIPMRSGSLRDHVERVDFDRDAVFGVFEDDLRNERVALFDYALKSHMDTARRLNAAAQGKLKD